MHLFRLGDEAEAAAAAAAAAAPPTPTLQANSAAAGGGDSTPDNPRSNFAFLGGLLPKAITPTYFQSQWSFAQFRLPGSEKNLTLTPTPIPTQPLTITPTLTLTLPGSEKNLTKNLCAFGPPGSHTFLVVSADGTFFKCSFDPLKGGDCTREDWQRFLIPPEDE